MSAGLPGLGLGGLFFIVSALLAPFGQLWRTVRGRDLPGEWRVVGRQFAQAATMVIAIDLTLRLVYLALAGVGVGGSRSAVSATVLPLTLIGITSGLLGVVLVLAKLGEVWERLAGDDRPRIPSALPRLHRGRALAYGTVAAAAWIVLLSVGAAELSPLSQSPTHPAPTKQLDATVERQPAAPPARVQRDLPSRVADDGAREATEWASNRSPPEVAAGGDAVSQPSSPHPSVSQTTVTSPDSSGASAPRGSPAGPPPPVVATPPPSPPSQAPPAPTPSGPPASPGPPENSNAPEGAGPPEEPRPSEHAGTGHP
jgi:hypothetical protein